MDFKLFAERIKAARKRAGLSQADLAKALGVGQNTISNYENATGEKGSTPKLDTAAKIADTLHVSLDWLVGNQEDAGKSAITNDEFLEKFIDLFQNARLDIYQGYPIEDDYHCHSCVICDGQDTDHQSFLNFLGDIKQYLSRIDVLSSANLPSEIQDTVIKGLKKELIEKHINLFFDEPEIVVVDGPLPWE